MSRTAMLIVVILAALPATAHAGGWATVEVDGQPTGLSAGEPWRVELLVKQHGVTPLDGVQPTVRIENDAGVTRTFPARPAGRPGTYVATVTYPSAGAWRTRIFDGFTDATPHRLSPVTIAPAGAGSGAPAAGDDAAWPQIVAIGLVALGFAGGIAATFPPRGARGRRRTAPRAVA